MDRFLRFKGKLIAYENLRFGLWLPLKSVTREERATEINFKTVAAKAHNVIIDVLSVLADGGFKIELQEILKIEFVFFFFFVRRWVCVKQETTLREEMKKRNFCQRNFYAILYLKTVLHFIASCSIH